MIARRVSVLLLLPLSACASWSAPEVIPIRGETPRQILILPVSKAMMGRQFAAQLDEAAGREIEERGYQTIRPMIASTLLSARGWAVGETDPGDLPMATLQSDHEVDAVLFTVLGDWQADPELGRYRYRVFWTLFDCETGREIWRYDDGGQIRPQRQIGEPQVLYDEDVAHGPGPRRTAPSWDRMSIEELAGLLQRAAALRLPIGPEHPDHAWTLRKN